MEKNSVKDLPLCLGRFAGAQGVRGLVRLHSFTALPTDILRYRPLLDAAGRELRLAGSGHPPQGRHGNILILRLEGIVTRTEAQSLNDRYVYTNRAALPPILEEDDFYHADLIGCRCMTEEGLLLGQVQAIHNFGAGDVLAITGGERGNLLLPFTKPNVPKVSIAENCLIVRLPAESEASEDAA